VNLKSAAALVVQRSPVPEILLRRRAQRHLTCVAYHRILDPVGADFPFDEEVISATPDEFDREIRYLKRNLDVISLPELLAGWNNPQSLASRPAIITFDDGYADNYTTAWPLLNAAGLSACFFLATAYIGTHRIPWWDQIACCFKFSCKPVFVSPFGNSDRPYETSKNVRKLETLRFLNKFKQASWITAQRCLERLREETGVDPTEHVEKPLFMDWAEVREMKESGMEIGGHTRNHPILSRVEDDATLNDEIRGCREDLRAKLDFEPTAFAYPVGSDRAMSEAADAAIRESGFRISFSYFHSFAKLNGDPVRLPRLHAEFGRNFDAFRLGMARAPIGNLTARNGQDYGESGTL
jgi:peptidoglycan/xylan/chitin deacetylase (PgdA/CDA1 family)